MLKKLIAIVFATKICLMILIFSVSIFGYQAGYISYMKCISNVGTAWIATLLDLLVVDFFFGES